MPSFCSKLAGEQLQFTAKLNFVTASKGMKKEFGHKSRMDGVQASPNNVKHATGITIQASPPPPPRMQQLLSYVKSH